MGADSTLRRANAPEPMGLRSSGKGQSKLNTQKVPTARSASDIVVSFGSRHHPSGWRFFGGRFFAPGPGAQPFFAPSAQALNHLVKFAALACEAVRNMLGPSGHFHPLQQAFGFQQF